jgi:hypothetical protein
MVIDPRRQFLKIIAPFAVFGGLATLFGDIIFQSDIASINASLN